MRIRIFFTFLLTIAFALLDLYGQENVTDPSTLFGKRVDGNCEQEFRSQLANIPDSCEIYLFKEGFHVQVNRNKNRQIYEITLRRENEDSTGVLSQDEFDHFITQVSKVHPIGARRVLGNSTLYTMARNSYWDLYEGVVVRRFFWYNKSTEESCLFRIAVLFPLKITGKIVDVQKFQVGSDPEAYIPKIYIGGCSYFALDKTLAVGSIGTFDVIGPQNESNGRCESFHLQMPKDESK